MAPIALVDEMKESPVHVSGDVKRVNETDKETIDLVLRQFRCLIADLCQQFNGGHPG
jgi:dihydroxyacetone synthase